MIQFFKFFFVISATLLLLSLGIALVATPNGADAAILILVILMNAVILVGSIAGTLYAGRKEQAARKQDNAK